MKAYDLSEKQRQNDPEATALLNSMLHDLCSTNFQPQQVLSLETLKTIVSEME